MERLIFTEDSMLRYLQDQIGLRFRVALCGDPSGVPPWLETVARGEGKGFYTPEDAPWVVHGDMATLVGGVRALLMQALHPGSLVGVKNHSRYKTDPLGRLAGTIQWLTVTTYASREALEKEAARVRGMHQKVKGNYSDAQSKPQRYSASDPHLLRWVHIAFMDSFLRCHQMYSSVPIPGGADDYIRLWSLSVEPLGLNDAPQNENDLLRDLEDFWPEIVVNEDTKEVLSWLKNPPLSGWAAKVIYQLLFQAALHTMPEAYRNLLNAYALPRVIVVPFTRFFLKVLRFAIGPENPIQDAAIERMAKSSA